MNRIDHIVVAAHSLEQGIEYIQAELGVDIPEGGFHATMGTHNHLMQLGNEVYLELIAINPDADIPRHPRWFALDERLMRESLKQKPRLITWVMNTPDIESIRQVAGFDIGKPTALQRNNLRWQFALPDDGRLLGNGMLPYVIQWHSRPHPANTMADLNCRLQSLQIHHNRTQWLQQQLESIGAQALVEIHQLDDTQSPYLSARIETPGGLKTLNSRIDPDY
jgi:hypothetical protein